MATLSIGRMAKAEPLLVDALERSRRVLGENHPQTGRLTALLGLVYSQLNQFEKAEVTGAPLP